MANTPQTETVEQSLRTELTTVQQSAAIVISDQESYDKAAALLLNIKTWRKRWAEYWQEPRDAAHKAWKALVGKFNEGDEPAAKAEAIVKNRILTWDLEQQRLREEAQRKADEEARRKAEAEQAEKALEMEIAGESAETIEAAMQEPGPVAAAPVAETYQKAAGISTRENWVCEVTDVKLLCKTIGAGKLKLTGDDTRKAKEFFEGLLSPHAKAMKSTMCVPGCAAVNRPIISGRAR